MRGDRFETLRQLAARYWFVFTSGVAAILTSLKVFYDYSKDSLSLQTWIVVTVGLTFIVLLRFPRVAIRVTRWILGPPPTPANPPQIFRGPLPYLDGDSLPARQAEIDACWRRLQTQAFVVLEGESGCGKSSLLNSALLPKARGRYRVIECRIAEDPLGRLISVFSGQTYRKTDPTKTEADLASAIANAQVAKDADKSLPLLLCIDQFEELFVTVRDEVRHQLMSVLRDSIENGDLRLLLAIRSDFRDLLLSLCREVDREQKALDLGSYFSLEAFPERQALSALDQMLAPLHGEDPLMKQQLEEFASRLVQELLLPPRDRRLSQDDAKTVLPVELQTVGMMIESVGIENFTEPGIQRLGGKAGLLRTYIEEAKDYVWRRTAVSGDRALLILRKLISEAKTKWAQTAAAIAADLRQPPAEVAAVLEAFAAKYLVKQLPGEEGQVGSLRYELMHEHLVRILIEAPQPILQRARDAEERLKFWLERTSSVSPRGWKWSFLFLPPIPFLEAIRLRRFATSPDSRRLIRASVPAFMLRAALLVALLVLILAPLVRQSAERTGVQIVTRFDSQAGIQAEDDGALWLLHDSGNLAQRKALETFLSNEQNARRFLEHAELILQSIGGLDADRTIAVVEPVWRDKCRDELSNLTYFRTPFRLQACAWIENELPAANGESWTKYLTSYTPEHLLVSLFAKLTPLDQDRALVVFKQAVRAGSRAGSLAAALLARAPAETFTREGPEILALLAQRATDTLPGFASALGGARSRQLREQATALLNETMQARAEDLEGKELLEWATGIAELRTAGWRIDPAVAAKAKLTLLASLKTYFKDPSSLSLLKPLGAFRPELDPGEVDLAKDFFLATYGECRGESYWELEGVLWFSNLLSERETALLIERLREGQGFPHSGGSPETLSRLYRRVADELLPHLSAPLRRQLTADSWERLAAADSLHAAGPTFLLLRGLVVDARQLGPQERATAELARVALSKENPSLRTLSTIVRTWWPSLLPQPKARVERLVREIFRRALTTGGSYEIADLADLLDDLDIAFSIKENREQLDRLLRRSVLPCDALAALARPETLDLVVGQGFRYPVCALGISPSLIAKLEKLDVLKMEDVGEWVGGVPALDRAKTAAWVRERGYPIAGRLLFKGISG